ncbi:MAG: N-acetyl sugar amidotransferase [Thermodesulfobacteriota bacterium]
MPLPRVVDVNVAEFARIEGPFEVKYGLPEDVKFCRKCVISNQRPSSAMEFKHTSGSRKATINFDEEGVCDACRFAERKQAGIDWEVRKQELRELCDRHRSKDGSFDCLVPGSGGKDSIYAAHMLKYEFGMNPLTITWAPHIYTDWGWRNMQSWIHSGFDNILYTPNGRIHRLMTRLAVEKLFHPFQPFIIGQKALAPKVAMRYGIGLIFYGENEAEYGNPVGENESARRSWEYFTSRNQDDIYIGGTSVAELIDSYGLKWGDLDFYLPQDPNRLEEAGMQVHYLGYYLRWHPQNCYYYAVENAGFVASPERTPGTYSKYNSIDDKVDDLHYYTTYIKFGIGRATYDAAQEIRSGDITREEGVALVRRYDGEFPERFLPESLDYLSLRPKEFPKASRMFEEPVMSRDYFMHLADRFRSPHLWRYDGGDWKLRHAVFQEAWAGGGHEDGALRWRGNAYRPAN